jgi:hypothetical protein
MDLNVELDGDEIVVTKPKSAFLLAYRKSIEEPRLVLTRSQMPQMSVLRRASSAPKLSKPRRRRRASWGGLCRRNQAARAALPVSFALQVRRPRPYLALVQASDCCQLTTVQSLNVGELGLAELAIADRLHWV